MELPDINVLVNAFRTDSPDHAAHSRWLDQVAAGSSSFGMSELVCSGTVRILTHPKIFQDPNTADEALTFVDSILAHHLCVVLRPGPRHWSIFRDLCRNSKARGNSIPDAYLAALAIEHGCEWVTADRGFARFPGLRCRFL